MMRDAVKQVDRLRSDTDIEGLTSACIFGAEAVLANLRWLG